MSKSKPPRLPVVELYGSPENIGAEYGKLAGKAAAREIELLEDNLARGQADKAELVENGKRLAEMLETFAPHWLAEAQVFCSVAGIEMEDYFALNSSLMSARPLPEECTCFLATGTATRTQESLLTKNRDFPRVPQSVYIKEMNGCQRFLGSGNPGDIGVAHFLNEKGLAAGGVTGQPTSDTSPAGLTERHLMRRIAETASTCQEALEMMREAVDRGQCMSEANASANVLFVDAQRGLIVENTAHIIEHQYIEDDVGVRGATALPRILAAATGTSEEHSERRTYVTSRLNQFKGMIDPGSMMRLSREYQPSKITNPGTVSAFTHIIREDESSLLSQAWVCCGNPNCSFYIPIHIGARGVHRSLVDGSFWQAAEAIFRALGAGDRLEAGHLDAEQKQLESEFAAQAAEVENQAWRLRVQGRLSQARDLLTQQAAEAAQQALDRITEIGGGGSS